MLIAVIVLLGSTSLAQPQNDPRALPYDAEYRTKEFSISFSPTYPLVIGEQAQVNLETKLDASEVTVYLPDESLLRLTKKNGTWTGRFKLKDISREGFLPLYVYIKHAAPAAFIDNFFQFLRAPAKKQEVLFTKRIWFRAFHPSTAQETPPAPETLPAATAEAFALELSPTGTSEEAEQLVIKGSRIFSFSSKNAEGTVESFAPGVNREESLRINIAGKVKQTEVNANFFSTSTLGTTQIASREESISILLRRGSTEAYFGDFTPYMDDLEFLSIGKRLTGLRVDGEYDNWGFKAIAAMPKGQPRRVKLYGDYSQGPYSLGGSPVVVDSEHIFLDGIEQKRGNDYDIDYDAGTFTFKHKSINNIQVIEATCDIKNTVFNHSTYALRGKYSPFENLRLNATLIDDSDALKDAAVISQNTSSEPQSHYLVGMDGTFLLGDLLSVAGEAAYSENKYNLLSSTGTKESGKAVKLDVMSNLGPFGFSGKYKRVGAGFNAIEALPKTNLSEYGARLSFSPANIFQAEVAAGEAKYTQDRVNYRIVNAGGRMKLSPKKLPSAEYIRSEMSESNDPVTAAVIERLTTKDTLELQHTLGFFKSALKGSYEKRVNRSPSTETTVYKTVNAGVSLLPREHFTAAANAELKQTELPNNTHPLTKTVNLDLALTPRREYLLSAVLNYVDDAIYGIKQVTDLTFKAEPSQKVKLNGKYRINSLDETFGSTGEGVRKEEASLNLELRPVEPLRLRYYYKPNFTILSRTQGRTYNNEVQQAELNLFVLSETMLGYSYQINSGFSIDKTDYPLYQRKQNSADLSTRIYTLKTAPLRFLSCEFNYILDDQAALTLSSTGEPAAYGKSNTRNRKFEAIVKTSLTEKVAFDSSYTQLSAKTGSAEVIDNTSDTLSQAGSIKLFINFRDVFTLTPFYSFTQTTNNLISDNRETYTASPGIGFILRATERVRVDGNASYARSYAGASTEKTNYDLRAKYDISDYVHITARTLSEISRNPDYKTSEFSGNVEINL